MVHDSWLQMASTAVNAVALVLASRNTPATDSTSAAAPTLSSADPATVTCTRELANWPGNTGSIDAGGLGEVGEPPHAEKNVASVAQEAT